MEQQKAEGKRMLDRLLKKGQFDMSHVPAIARDQAIFRERAGLLWKRLQSAEVFDISNVAEYFWNGTSQEEWNLFSDFPCLMPPFSNLWMEYKLPANIATHIGRTCGLLIQTAPQAPGHLPHQDSSHVTHCTIFLESRPQDTKGTICGPIITVFYQIDKQGLPIPHSGNKLRYSVEGWNSEYAGGVNRKVMEALFHTVYPAALALTFLNCKNTFIVENKPDAKLQKAHTAAHQRPLVSFKTLEIKVLKQILAASTGGTTDIKRSLHICRGHFKDFREHGLFGRSKGLYWWGPQARGTASKGVALKDYKLGKATCEE